MDLLGTQRRENTTAQLNILGHLQEHRLRLRHDPAAPKGARLRLLLLTIGGLYLPREPLPSIHLSEAPFHADRLFRSWR